MVFSHRKRELKPEPNYYIFLNQIFLCRERELKLIGDLAKLIKQSAPHTEVRIETICADA